MAAFQISTADSSQAVIGPFAVQTPPPFHEQLRDLP